MDNTKLARCWTQDATLWRRWLNQALPKGLSLEEEIAGSPDPGQVAAVLAACVYQRRAANYGRN